MRRFVTRFLLRCSLALLPTCLLVAPLQSARAAMATAYETTPEGNARYLADYAAQPGVIKLPSGLMYKIVEAGDGKGTSPLARQDIVTVEYRGWLINNKVFDRTQPGEPHTFTTGNLIAGWGQALYKMKTGAMWQLVIPASLAYGAEGRPPIIPPGQTLVFLVKLEKVEYP